MMLPDPLRAGSGEPGHNSDTCPAGEVLGSSRVGHSRIGANADRMEDTMKYFTRIMGTVTLLSGLVLLGYSTAAAQRPTHAQAVTPHVRSTPRSDASPRPSASEPKVTSFRGIASKLNTTPDALQSAYQAALAANPKLTRGQFIAANVLAQNLGTKDPNVTTQAILDGLKSGKSIGKTLQGLGLSATEAEKAQKDANSEIRRAGQQPRDSTK